MSGRPRDWLGGVEAVGVDIMKESQLQAEIDRLDGMLAARKAVAFHRDQVRKHRSELARWERMLEQSEAVLRDAVMRERAA